jgi:nitrous oxide reductase
MKLKPISIQLDLDLKRRIEKLVKEGDYKSMAEAIIDLLRIGLEVKERKREYPMPFIPYVPEPLNPFKPPSPDIRPPSRI